MKVMYITLRPPFPPYKGDQLIANEQIRNSHMRNHEIYLVTFITDWKEEETIRKELSKYCKDIFFLNINKVKMIFNTFKTIYNRKPIQVNMFTDSLIKNRLLKIYQEVKPDVIHIQYVRLAEYFMNIHVPKVVDMIDALSLNMNRRGQKEKFLLKKFIFNIESNLLKKYEKKVLANYDKVLLVSEKEKAYLKNFNNIVVNPNGVNMTREHFENYKNIKKEKALIFHGNMQYFPNVEGVLYFVNEIWPTIYNLYPEYKLYIVGKDPIDKIKKIHNINNIIVTGFVEDIYEFISKATLGVYILNSGTGMQNKILEALACGLPIVATPLAIQGFPNITTNEVYIAKTKDDIITGIKKLIENEDIRQQFLDRGQAFVFNNYSWDKNVCTLIETWERAIQSHK